MNKIEKQILSNQVSIMSALRVINGRPNFCCEMLSDNSNETLELLDPKEDNSTSEEIAKNLPEVEE